MTNEELERRVAALEHDHALTRWYTGRVDRDLAEISATQAEHTGRLIRIENRLDRVETTLDEHTATLAGHTTTLAGHTTTLAEHSERLDRIETKQVEHSARFDSVDAQLRSLTQMVGVVLKRMPQSDLPGD